MIIPSNHINSNEIASEASCNIRKRNSSSSGSISDKRTATKICRVCGDKAYSYNFNVITCESCKAFFRRNANKEKELRCPFNEQCDINVLSRRFCQRCRLRKCFEVGMKKEWIMSEEARLEKKQRVQENRERRLAEAYVQNSVTRKASRGRENMAYSTTDTTNNFHQLSIVESPAIFQPTVSTINASLVDQSGAESSRSDLPVDTSVKDNQSHALPNCLPVAFKSFADTSMDVNFFLPDQSQTVANDNLNRPPTLFQDEETNNLGRYQKQNADFQNYSTNQSHTYPGVTLASSSSFSPVAVLPNVNSYIQPSTVIQPSEDNTTLMSTMSSDDDLIMVSKNMVLRFFSQQIHMPLANNSRNDITRKCCCTCRCGRYPRKKPITEAIAAEISQESASISGNKEFLNNTMKEISISRRATENGNEWNLPLFKDDRKSFDSSSDANVYLVRNSQTENNNISKGEAESTVNSGFLPMSCQDEERLSEVINANTFWAEIEPNSVEAVRHKQGCLSKAEFVNMADGAIRRMIKMVKRIASYKQLDDHDQIQLLKSSCMKYIILRGAMCYDPEQNAWKGPTTTSGYVVKMDAMKDTSENMFESSIRFYATFKEEWRTNESVMLLLGMLVIFNPDLPNLHEPERVKIESDVYKRVLKSLIFTLCGCNERRARTELRGLMDNLAQLKVLNFGAVNMLKEVDTKTLEPLLLEFRAMT